MPNRVTEKFESLKRSGRKGFIAYIAAGDPDLETTRKLVLEFDRVGVDLVELGVPFSDP
ncbi:MAG: tryptophan synthase subunit alpha, partial [Candidatus Abyssubacteria bacterium]|nr:tryptophan synthase subunit alpha [Candidatus Abyssubacteria bacterium]